MNADDVAVIIVNYNAGDYLRRCIATLTQQTVLPGRVVVVDNHSQDGSVDNLDGAGIALTVLRQSRNLGFAAANNLAIETCSAYSWVVLLNPDAFAQRDWLEQLLKGARDYPDYRCFASRQMMAALQPAQRKQADKAQTDQESDNSVCLDGAGDVYHSSGLAWRRGHGSALAANYLHEQPVFGPCAAAAMYDRDLFVRAGGFDEAYFCYFEDVDLAFRLQLAGYPCMYLPEAVVEHIGSATTGAGSEFSVYHGHRNLVWTYVKNTPTALLWRTLPLHIAVNIASLAIYSCRGRARAIWRAKWDAIRQLPRVMKQRKVLQQQLRYTIAIARSTEGAQSDIPSWRELRGRMARGLNGLLRR